MQIYMNFAQLSVYYLYLCTHNPLRFFKYGMVFFIRPDRKFTILSKVQRTEHPARRVFLTCTDTAHNGCSHTTGTQESHNCFLFVSVDYLLQEIVYHAYFQRNKCSEYIYLSSTNPLLKFYSCPTFLAFLVRPRITLVACCR